MTARTKIKLGGKNKTCSRPCRIRWKQDIHGRVNKVHVIRQHKTYQNGLGREFQKERDDMNSTEVVLELVKL